MIMSLAIFAALAVETLVLALERILIPDCYTEALQTRIQLEAVSGGPAG